MSLGDVKIVGWTGAIAREIAPPAYSAAMIEEASNAYSSFVLETLVQSFGMASSAVDAYILAWVSAADDVTTVTSSTAIDTTTGSSTSKDFGGGWRFKYADHSPVGTGFSAVKVTFERQRPRAFLALPTSLTLVASGTQVRFLYKTTVLKSWDVGATAVAACLTVQAHPYSAPFARRTGITERFGFSGQNLSYVNLVYKTMTLDTFFPYQAGDADDLYLTPDDYGRSLRWETGQTDRIQLRYLNKVWWDWDVAGIA